MREVSTAVEDFRRYWGDSTAAEAAGAARYGERNWPVSGSEIEALRAEVEMYERRVDELNAEKAELRQQADLWKQRAVTMRERVRELEARLERDQ